jgi:toxin ParE1/3/4
MKVVYTDAARGDLEDIADWLTVHYPTIASTVEQRIRAVVARIARWPQSAQTAGRREWRFDRH